MSETSRLQVGGEETGPEAPNQPIYEGFQAPESEAPAQEDTSVGQPADVPDKFRLEDGSVDVNGMLASYAELEQKLAGGEAEPAQETTQNSQDALSEENLQVYTQEVAEHGNLTEESYAALEEYGYPRDLVAQYVAGQQAQAAVAQQELLTPVGGMEGYGKLTEWADKNLSEQEISAYDAVMNSGNHSQMQMNIQGLYARFQQATGIPSLIQGDTGSTSASSGYRSWSEVTEAMRNPLYQKDPAYRRDVQNRLAASDLNA